MTSRLKAVALERDLDLKKSSEMLNKLGVLKAQISAVFPQTVYAPLARFST